MDENLFLFLFSLSILFPAILGAIRYTNSSKEYLPFLWYIFISLFNELLVGTLLVHTPKSTQLIDWNLFNLFECLIFLTQFYYWKIFTGNKKIIFTLAVVLVIIWIFENLVKTGTNLYLFLIAYSFILALFSIYMLNTIVTRFNRSLFKNSMFIICAGMVIYFIYTIIVFVFLSGSKDKQALREVFHIKVYINAFVNLMYAVAVYFIPKKPGRVSFFEGTVIQRAKQSF